MSSSGDDYSYGSANSSRRASRAASRRSSSHRPSMANIHGAAAAGNALLDLEVERATGPPPERFRVAMLGASGVGKSALTSQFLSSDHMNTYDNVGKNKNF